MKKITVSILTTLLMLSMVFSSSVFAANEQPSAWESFLGLLPGNATTTATDAVGVEYRGHVQNKGDFPLDGSWIQGPDQLGTVGESLRLEAFWIKLTNEVPAGLHIQYRVHVQNKGWMAPVEDGDLAGTQGEGLQIESVEIKLVDDAGNPAVGYSVEYRGHIQNKGDMPADGSWYKDGEALGTVGEFLRLEALEVKIVQTKADMTAYNAAVAAAAALTEADYTADSWAALQTALATVVTEDNTQAEVDAATAAINAAIDALVVQTRISSLEATGLKQLTVTFNQAVDTDAASISVLKGASTSIGVSSISWNADATVATLTLASKLTEATYTVNVANVATDVLTASVDTEAETVTEIVIASDIGVINGTDFTVGYTVNNQYGEDMTSKVSTITGNATSGAGTPVPAPSTGIVTTPLGTLVSGDTTTLTLVDSGTGVVASKKLTISDAAAIAEITYGVVYNEDGYELSENYTAEVFYLVVDAKDQYGSKVDAAALNAASAVVNSTSDSSVLDFISGTVFYDMDINDDDVDETVAKLDAANMTEGTATLRTISLFNGAKAQTTLTVAPATKVDTITMEQPDLAVVGEDVVIPYEALDLSDEAVTTLSKLNAVTLTATPNTSSLGGTASASFKNNASTGKVELILDLSSVTDVGGDGGKVTLQAVTPTGNVTVLSVIVEEAATPTLISGLDDVTLNPTVGGTASMEFDDLIIVDQFDRVMDNSTVGSTVDVTIANATVADFDNAGDVTSSIVYNNPLTVYGQAKGTTDITFAINGVSDSDYTTSVRVAATSEFDSYTLSTVGTIYDNSATDGGGAGVSQDYNETLTVYGVTSNGSQVVVPAANYNVVITGQSGVVADPGTNSTSIGTATDTVVTYATDATTATATALVTINATGEQYTQTLTISKVEPVVSTIVMGSSVVSGGYDLTTATFTAANIAALIDGTDSVDNYGEAYVSAAGQATFADTTTTAMYYTVTAFVDADSGDDYTITGNGTTGLSMAGLETGDSFTVTVTADGVSTVFGVAVQ